LALHGLEQRGLPPRERYQLRTKSGARLMGGEGVGFLNATEVQLYVDLAGPRMQANGKAVELPSSEAAKVLSRLVVAVPSALPTEDLLRAVMPDVGEKIDKKTDTKFKAVVRDLTKVLK